PLLINWGTSGALVAGLLCQGLARGSLSIIVVLVLMELREVDSARMGAAAGLYFTAGEIGGVLGPLTIGTLYDVTGNFSAALDALAALCLWQLLLLSRLRLALRLGRGVLDRGESPRQPFGSDRLRGRRRIHDAARCHRLDLGSYAGSPLQELVEILAREHQQMAVAHRDHIGVARPRSEQAHLAEKVSFLERNRHFADMDRDLARGDEIHRVGPAAHRHDLL